MIDIYRIDSIPEYELARVIVRCSFHKLTVYEMCAMDVDYPLNVHHESGFCYICH